MTCQATKHITSCLGTTRQSEALTLYSLGNKNGPDTAGCRAWSVIYIVGGITTAMPERKAWSIISWQPYPLRSMLPQSKNSYGLCRFQVGPYVLFIRFLKKVTLLLSNKIDIAHNTGKYLSIFPKNRMHVILICVILPKNGCEIIHTRGHCYADSKNEIH